MNGEMEGMEVGRLGGWVGGGGDECGFQYDYECGHCSLLCAIRCLPFAVYYLLFATCCLPKNVRIYMHLNVPPMFVGCVAVFSRYHRLFRISGHPGFFGCAAFPGYGDLSEVSGTLDFV